MRETALLHVGFHDMPRVVIGAALARWLDSPEGQDSLQVKRVEREYEVAGDTLRDVLGSLFATVPQLRSYVVDEHFAVRHHVAIFIDGQVVTDREQLATAAGEAREIYIMQALSGG
jgi:sulfur-carrier protein